MIYSGLVSVTFRKLTPERIVELVSQADLDGIEWGGDIHVPHGNKSRAREVYRMTVESGLHVASYGSYYRVGCDTMNSVDFESVLETAVELKAPIIRVWAGNRGSKESDKAWWNKLVTETQTLAGMAESAGITIAFEYHNNTLTDTPEAAKKFMQAIGHKNIRCYWQPSTLLNETQREESLTDILPWLSHLHVFQWSEGQKLPLSDGMNEWKRYIEIIKALESNRYCMLEFVKDDTPEQFLEDAKTLKTLLL